jgi:hypothetical protein
MQTRTVDYIKYEYLKGKFNMNKKDYENVHFETLAIHAGYDAHVLSYKF